MRKRTGVPAFLWVALICPTGVLQPFSAEKVAQALEQIRVRTPAGLELTIQVEEIQPIQVADSPSAKEIRYKIVEVGNPDHILGSGWRQVVPRDPSGPNGVVYPRGAIELDVLAQDSGLGSAQLRVLFEAAPEGGGINLTSANQPTNEDLQRQMHELIQTRTVVTVDHLEAGLTAYTRATMRSKGNGPLLGRLLYRAGWREIRVEVVGLFPNYGYAFTAVKPASGS